MVIGGFVNQVSRRLGADDTSQEKLRIVTQETARLEFMVREMLNFGRPMEIQLTKTDLNQLVQETVEVAQPIATKNGLGINIDLEASFPPLMLDVAKFKRMLLNLITNAIQVSPIGECVIVKTRLKNYIAKLEVIDSGPGINQEDEKNIFNPFFSKKDGGTGLGLAIAKKIVEAHRGKISYHSDGAKGAAFIVQLPFRRGKN
jgi:signal transduction histidine kinase